MNLDNIYSNQDLSKYYNFLVLLALKGNEKYSTDKAKLFLTDESDLNLMFEINKLYGGFIFIDDVYSIEPFGRGIIINYDTLSQFIDNRHKLRIKFEQEKSEDRILDNTFKVNSIQDISGARCRGNIAIIISIVAIIATIGVVFIPSCLIKHDDNIQQPTKNNTKSEQTNSNTNVTKIP